MFPSDQNNQEEKKDKKPSSAQGSPKGKENDFSIQAPSITLPKGGGALKNIDEHFEVNAANGTCSFSIPLPISKSRGDFAPALSLAYNSGSGNGCFGLGWSCHGTTIQRRTEKKLPLYQDADDSDIFQLTGAEDLVPYLQMDGMGNWSPFEFVAPSGETVKRYRPRIEGSFDRIERITPKNSKIFFWKITSTKNVVTILGRSPLAQIADPEHPEHIFQWLPEFSFDDKGNAMEYTYLPENLLSVVSTLGDQNRFNQKARFVNSYLQTVRYGNLLPYTLDPTTAYNPLPVAGAAYLFEIVFDFGDHDLNEPTPAVQGNWPARLEPFSNYQAGFEVRTYRLCERVLLFHHIKEMNDGVNAIPLLVRSLDLQYRYFNNPAATSQEKRNAETDYIIGIQESGYIKTTAGYSKKSLPPLSFTYQELSWNTNVQDVTAENLENDPVGLGSNYQWLDLWSEGISGILTEQGNGWFYKSNLGQGQFSPVAPVIPKPSLTGLSGGQLQLQDLEADGRKFIVSLQDEARGYFELSDGGNWQPFESFVQVPKIDWTDSNTKMIDLNGDGRTDIILSGENVFTWYANLGKMGYKGPEYTEKMFNEEEGPYLVSRDPIESIYMADMTGDGLTDIVRIRNGELCYWPNKGYGKFGAKVNMNNAPVFDYPDLYNPAFIHLADISGTGTTDIIYLGKDTLAAWINCSGNGWSETVSIDNFPFSEAQDQVAVLDFLGNGTACIVWSSALPRYQDAPLRYIDLMGGKKPYIISSYVNNMGKQLSYTYTSSTFFYLLDKMSGTPWVTKLPFPVQCVSKVMVNDLAAGNYLTTEYSYHHGYYDHAEREFRGFGRVEQTDTEDISNFILSGSNNVLPDELQQAPVKTITWFHTGAYFHMNQILNQFEQEYNKGPFEFDLPEPALPQGLTPIESREALRACKGVVLRQEIYGLDGSALQAIPYSIAKNNCLIKLFQPKHRAQYAVFLTHQSETINIKCERNQQDPKILHKLNLVVDDFGHIRQSASVVYGRKTTDASLPLDIQIAQSRINIVYTINDFTNSFDTASCYRLPLPAETKTLELTGIQPLNGISFSIQEMLNDQAGAAVINYEIPPNNTSPQQRLIEDLQILYLKNDLLTPLPLYQMDTLALVSQQYKMAFSPSLVTHLFGSKIGPAELTSAHYLQLDGINWWIPSGTNSYLHSLETAADALKRFYLPVSVLDGLGSQTLLTYDDYFLILLTTQDAMLNLSTVETVDYRVLQPTKILDINQNTAEVLFDELGRVFVTSVYGTESDGLHGDQPLSAYTIIEPADLAEVISNPLKFLQEATSFFYYDLADWLDNLEPSCFASVTRQTHTSELSESETTKTFISVAYSSGMGQDLQTKILAEPGEALQWIAGVLSTVDTTPNPRWVGTGRTILNNKGNPVKQYEPFFSTTYEYETEAALVEIGFSSILYYDPPGRNILTRHPNGTLSRTTFDAWEQFNFDENDTVLESPWYTALGSPNPAAAEPANPQVRAAWLAAKQADTPSESHFDSQGRSIYSVANNGADGKYASVQLIDVENNLLSVTDARNNIVMRYDYDMLQRRIQQFSMDRGDSLTFPDVIGKPIQDFTTNTDQLGNPTDYVFMHEYDVLHRPTNFWLTTSSGGPSTTMLIEVIQYGENQPADTSHNLRGKVFQQYDQSGLIQISEYDFKGNIKNNSKQLCSNYKSQNDWNRPDKSTLLDPESFDRSSRFDATNKPTLLVSPDGSQISPSYNEANLLKQLDLIVAGQNISLQLVQQIDYNAKGQRERIVYGNNSSTGYTYEDTSFRLVRILTTRNKGADILQDLNYTFDPAGNITQIVDNAQQTLYFNNAGVDPSSKFEYDATYRLVHAIGREHAGQNAASDQFDYDKTTDTSGNRLVFPGDINAMQNYEEIYQYDEVGNMLQMVHNAGMGSFSNRWTRNFTPRSTNNQLISAQVGVNTTNYDYDEHGNMFNLQNGSFNLSWNYADQLQQMDLGGGGTAYYVFDNSGQRVRKVIETDNLVKERIYLGGYEVYRELLGGKPQLERQTLHVMDDKERIVLVETRTMGTDSGLAFLIRHQYNNQLGTACLELVGNPDPTNSGFIPSIISYEEYYPFGSSAYQSMDNQVETAKRYRYTGKERDEESGLYYFGARYYAPWLARWTATDPIGIADGLNIYMFVSGNPIKKKDENGTDGGTNQLHLDPDLIAKTQALLASNDTTTVTVTNASGQVVSTTTTPNDTQSSSNASDTQQAGATSGNAPLKLTPPSDLFTSFGQPWQAIANKQFVLEYNWNVGGSLAHDFRNAATGAGGGLNDWIGSVRRGYEWGKLKGDIGGYAGITATGGTGGSATGGTVGLIVHNQLKLDDEIAKDWGLGIYIIPSVAFGPYTGAGGTATFVLGQEPDSGANKDYSLSFGYFSKGQFASPSSPLFSNVFSADFLYSWGETEEKPSRSKANEVYATYYHGSSTDQSDKSAPATGHAVRVGYGHNWQWNWKQGTEQYNGLGLYLGVAAELDIIDRQATVEAPSKLELPVTVLGIGSVSIGGSVW